MEDPEFALAQLQRLFETAAVSPDLTSRAALLSAAVLVCDELAEDVEEGSTPTLRSKDLSDLKRLRALAFEHFSFDRIGKEQKRDTLQLALEKLWALRTCLRKAE